jgi:hypothetical protein
MAELKRQEEIRRLTEEKLNNEREMREREEAERRKMDFWVQEK